MALLPVESVHVSSPDVSFTWPNQSVFPRGSRMIESRPLYKIAREIRRDWAKVNYAAVPYLNAMGSLDNVREYYGADDAKSIVLYFLGNARSWKGETAKRIKSELKALAGIK